MGGDERHQRRMQRKKEVVDAAIARADRDRGIVVLHTGNGKGKTSAAMGLVARALGHGLRVGVVQFVKQAGSAGEEAFFRRFPEVLFHVDGEGFTWETQDRARDAAAAARAWAVARQLLADPGYDLVVLDELTYVVNDGHVPIGEVVAALNGRPVTQHVVVTGRAAPPELVELADTVSEMRDIKHAFRDGVRAQRGIEF